MIRAYRPPISHLPQVEPDLDLDVIPTVPETLARLATLALVVQLVNAALWAATDWCSLAVLAAAP